VSTGRQHEQSFRTFKWSALPPLRFPRYDPVALLLEDGRVLIVGRRGWLYDAKRGWRQHKDLEPEALDAGMSHWEMATGLVASDGKLLGVRGLVYEPGTRKWESVQRVPDRPLTGSCVCPEGTRLTVGGGKYLEGDTSLTAQNFCILESPAGLTHALRMSWPRVSPTLTFLPDGRLLITGGFDVDSYFPDRDKMLPVPEAEILEIERQDIVPGGRHVTARFGHGVTVLPDGSVLLVGGADHDSPSLAEAEIGHPHVGSW